MEQTFEHLVQYSRMERRVETLIQLTVLASRYSLRPRLQERLVWASDEGAVSRAEVYEAFLQIYLFAGFPAGLEAMRSLSRAWPEAQEDALGKAERETMSYPAFLERGQKLYKEIYSDNAETVRAEMLKLSPELAAWAVIEGYGKTLSRPGLDVKARELCIVGLLTRLGWERQLYSHVLGAMNVGASKGEIATAIAIGSMQNNEKLEMGKRLLARIASSK